MIPAALALFLSLQGTAAPAPVVTPSPPEAVVLEPGRVGEARLRFTIREGFHIQANPASEPYLVPAQLDLTPEPRVRVGAPIYPPGRPYRIRGAERDFMTYQGTFEVRMQLEALGDALPTELRLAGALRYQACNERICLRPTSASFLLPVRIVANVKGRLR